MLSKQFIELLESYVSNRFFKVEQRIKFSELKERAGILQNSILSSAFYLWYKCDLLHIEYITITTFAGDTIILATGEKKNANNLQRTCNQITCWTKNWRIKQSSQNQCISTNKNLRNQMPIINGNPCENTPKYLDMTHDVKLRWKEFLKIKEMIWTLVTENCILVQWKKNFKYIYIYSRV